MTIENVNSPEYLQRTLEALTALQALLEPLTKDSPRARQAHDSLEPLANILQHALTRRSVEDAFTEADFENALDRAFDKAILECWGAR